MTPKHELGPTARRARHSGWLIAALSIAAAGSAAAATPHPASQAGAFCTRPGCAGRERPVASGLAGFALATLAAAALGRRRGSPPA